MREHDQRIWAKITENNKIAWEKVRDDEETMIKGVRIWEKRKLAKIGEDEKRR